MTADHGGEYQRLVELGATPLEVAQVAHARSMGVTKIIRLIRALYPLEFVQAKDIATQAVYGMGLSEYQERYILPLLEELEREGVFEKEE